MGQGPRARGGWAGVGKGGGRRGPHPCCTLGPPSLLGSGGLGHCLPPALWSQLSTAGSPPSLPPHWALPLRPHQLLGAQPGEDSGTEGAHLPRFTVWGRLLSSSKPCASVHGLELAPHHPPSSGGSCLSGRGGGGGGVVASLAPLGAPLTAGFLHSPWVSGDTLRGCWGTWRWQWLCWTSP